MKSKESRKQRSAAVIILILVLAFSILMLGVNFFTDWIWFKEMGYVNVFFKQLTTELKVGIPMFLIVAVIVNIYLKRLKKGYFNKIVSDEITDMTKLNRYTNIISIVFALIASVYTVINLWFQILQFANSTDFNIKDPLFNMDVSFYIFKLDFLKQLNEMLIGLVFLTVAVTIIYYMILLVVHSPNVLKHEETYENPYEENPYSGNGNNPFSKMFGGRTKTTLDDGNFKELLGIASGQLTFLGVVFFLMLALHFFLKQFDLLNTHTGVVHGAGFTDVHVTLWVYRALIVLALAGAFTVVHHIHKRQFKKILTIPVIMIIIGVVGTVAGFAVQYVVSTDEINKEAPYLERNIAFTQKAYQLDDVSVKSFAADNKLTGSDVKANSETINNIRINDYTPVKTFYTQTQSIRKYYKFNDVDVDRYMDNGKYTQTYLSTLEIDDTKLQDTWLNRHLKFTHGYGVTLSRVDIVTDNGQPDVMIKNIPPESEIDEIDITRPEVYFGELSNDYIIVNAGEDEFDYPEGDTNKYTQYKGNAGIKLSLPNRILFALREQNMKLLVSSNINSNSKIIINRNVMERVKKIMPHLSYENDPYAVIADGKIYWMVDAYTTSTNYPYSEPFGEKQRGVKTPNYIRNSVKAVVDAYNGDVNFYVVDENDPIAKTYQKIYPNLFKSADKMPEGLKSHIRYPNALFAVQAQVYSRYHMDDVKVFYLDEDAWDIADQMYGTEKQKMLPNYYIVKLPGEEKAEFINSIPFTPKSKQNMTGLMVARNDGEHYGDLVLYSFPKNKTVYGPMQIEAQIDQKPEISSDFTLWSSAGSKYSRGNLFVIPIESSLLYVEPVYLEAANSAIPEVKRVIVAYDNKIAYEPTLEEALNEIFGNETGDEVVDQGDTSSSADKKPEKMSQKDLIKKASEAFKAAQNALQNDNWTEYGKQMDIVQKNLEKLEK